MNTLRTVLRAKSQFLTNRLQGHENGEKRRLGKNSLVGVIAYDLALTTRAIPAGKMKFDPRTPASAHPLPEVARYRLLAEDAPLEG